MNNHECRAYAYSRMTLSTAGLFPSSSWGKILPTLTPMSHICLVVFLGSTLHSVQWGRSQNLWCGNSICHHGHDIFCRVHTALSKYTPIAQARITATWQGSQIKCVKPSLKSYLTERTMNYYLNAGFSHHLAITSFGRLPLLDHEFIPHGILRPPLDHRWCMDGRKYKDAHSCSVLHDQYKSISIDYLTSFWLVHT